MRQLLLTALLLTAIPLAHTEETFTLFYSKENKWLAADQKAPLVALRTATEKQSTQPVMLTVQLPQDNPKLQEKRLSIAAEIISRKSNGIIIKKSGEPAPKNQIIFKFK